MNAQRYQQIHELFLRVRKESPEVQQSILDEAGAKDPDLRRQVQALLAADADPLHLDSVPVGDIPRGLQKYGPVPMPERIGHYTIRQVLAIGGMGVVYEAEQEHPHRTVALKVLRRGIVSSSALRRFEYEAQILARLRHPNIAQVYEAGMHEEAAESLPYFAMEYVPNAKTLIQFVHEKQLDLCAQLELFLKVCNAVHHGHQKGIIHRDLKPANILVDGEGEPKIIDFGVARATDADMAVRTMQTDIGQLIGTLQYMSPEQCAADPHDLDSRSDVYSLGVVLYELICGQLPYDVSATAVPEAIRMVREDTPTRPSTINRRLRGDLETIALKALAKERERRYHSAAELADDIRRYLRDEPIVARPPSTFYQFRKFARRNKILVSSVALLFVVLCAAVAVSTSFALKESKAQANAHKAWLAEQQQRAAAEREAEISQAVNDFLNHDLLAAVAPSGEEGRGKDVLMREVLDEAAKHVNEAAAPGGRFADKPLIEASLRRTLGNTYRQLSLYEPAEIHITRAVEILREQLGEEHDETLGAMSDLAWLYMARGQYDDSRPLIMHVLQTSRRLFGDTHPRTLEATSHLAKLYSAEGRYKEAKPLFVQVLDDRRRLLGAEHLDTLASMDDLGELYRDQGEFDAAEQLLTDAFQGRRARLGDDDPATIQSMAKLGLFYKERGKFEQADQLLVEAVEASRRVLGEAHHMTLNRMSILAGLYWMQRKLDDAEALVVKSLEIQSRVLGNTHPDTLGTRGNLATLYYMRGRFDEAATIFEEVSEQCRLTLGETHPTTLKMMNNLAAIYRVQERWQEAESSYQKMLKIRRELRGEKNPETLISAYNLAVIYGHQEKYEQAAQYHLEALAGRREVLGVEHPDTRESLFNLADIYRHLGQYDEAEVLMVELMEVLERLKGPNHNHVLQCMRILGELHVAREQYAQAEAMYRDAVDRAEQTRPVDDARLARLRGGWGACLVKLEQYQEAETQLLASYDALEATLDPTDEEVCQAAQQLAELYDAWDKPQQADEWRARLPDENPPDQVSSSKGQ